MSRWVVALIWLAWLFGVWDSLRAEPKPPRTAGRATYGCIANLVEEPDGQSRWHVHVYMKYNGTEWRRLLSIRYPNERKKALSDCHKWLDKVQKR